MVCGSMRAPLLQMLSIVGHNTHVPSKWWGGILTQNRAISRQHVRAWGHKVAWDAPSPCQRLLLCSLFVPPKMERTRPPLVRSSLGRLSPGLRPLILSKDLRRVCFQLFSNTQLVQISG